MGALAYLLEQVRIEEHVVADRFDRGIEPFNELGERFVLFKVELRS